jgi:hypothetical protein
VIWVWRHRSQSGPQGPDTSDDARGAGRPWRQPNSHHRTGRIKRRTTATRSLLGDLGGLKATIWQRLLLITTTQLGAGPVDPIEDLRHLTAHQVGALLGLKAAYVHELCRTGRITATKSGKYWLIPLAAAIVVGVSEE